MINQSTNANTSRLRYSRWLSLLQQEPHSRVPRRRLTIDGSVTVASGAFSSSTFDQGFAIQDKSGGIYVSTSDNLGFAPRQQVRVTGTLADTLLPGLRRGLDGHRRERTQPRSNNRGDRL